MRKLYLFFAKAIAILLFEIFHGGKRRIKHINYYTVSNTYTCSDWADQKISAFFGEFKKDTWDKLKPYCSLKPLPDMQTTIQVWAGVGLNQNLVYEGAAESYINYSIYPADEG